MRSMILIAVFGFLIIGIPVVGAQASSQSSAGLVAHADAAFVHRVNSDEMQAAIAYYEQSLPLLPVQSQAYVLNRLAQCYYELSTFSSGNTPADKKLFEKGKEYGMRSLRLNPEFARLEKDNFAAAVEEVTDPAALLWTADNWGALFGYNPLQGMVNVAKVKALYERGIEINETYWGASFHNALGAMLITLPSFLGGDPGQGRSHLERAIVLAPDYLENHVVYAQYWGFTYNLFGKINGIRDQKLIERELGFVLKAPIGDWPFWNREAKKEAKSLLEKERELVQSQ